MDETKQLIQNTSLRFGTDLKPGIKRIGSGDGFYYVDPNGDKIDDAETLERIKKLVIPPAWKDVWISTSSSSHLQATGRDEKNRKQYRYHEKWNKLSQANKFSDLLDFAKALPKIRRRVKKDMRTKQMTREKVLATVVWLLENTLIRIGNEEYEKENRSYGLTTLKNRHVNVRGDAVKFQFKGKSGVEHEVRIRDRRVANVIRHCKELPGQELFEYIDDEKTRQIIRSEDVNEYLREITGMEISAKDFRTWGGTTLAAELLNKKGALEAQDEVKQFLTDTVKEVAKHLRNKPATCRKYYIHPKVLEIYEKGDTITTITEKIKKAVRRYKEMDDHEHGVLSLLIHAHKMKG